MREARRSLSLALSIDDGGGSPRFTASAPPASLAQQRADILDGYVGEQQLDGEQVPQPLAQC